MESTHESSTIEATIQRNLLELNNAILKVTAHDELVKQGLTYTEMSFFVIAQHALYNDILTHAIRVLDEHRDAMSFWYLLRCKEGIVFKQAAQKVGLDLEKLKDLSAKLKSIRNKTLFHIDRRSVRQPEAVWMQAEIIGSALFKALNEMFETLAIAKRDHFDGEFETITKYDGSDIAKIIKAYEIGHCSVPNA